MRAGVLVFLVMGLAGCGGRPDPPSAVQAESTRQPGGIIEIPANSPKLTQIRTVTVENRDLPLDEFTAPGSIEVNPNRISRVLLPVAGRVMEVFVRFGDPVKKNDALLTLESPEADAAVSAYLQSDAGVTQAQVALTQAKVDLERTSDLYQADAVARKEFVAAETAYRQAEIALRQAEAARQQALARLEMLGLKPGFRERVTVRAPISGKITEMNVVEGEFRNDLSAPVLTIADLSTVWMSADVPEAYIRFVNVGEEFEVRLNAYPGEVFISRVMRIADRVDRETRTIDVWAELANPTGRLRPEMFGEVRHVESIGPVPAVPYTAVIQAQGQTAVFQELGPGRFRQVAVETGRRAGDWMPVLKGLQPGDRVVADGAMLLRGY